MLAFKDFAPRQLRAPHFGFSTESFQGEYESLEHALAAVNEWRRSEHVRVVTVETVVVPSLWERFEHGTTDPVLSSPGATSHWFQFFRVWYEAEEVDPA